MNKKRLVDKRNVQLTSALFKETFKQTKDPDIKPIYTLRDYDIEGYPSAYQIYIESVDEVDAAIKLLGSLSHWRKLTSLKWFMEGDPSIGFSGLKQWREDKTLLEASMAKEVILSQCKSGNLSAAKSIRDICKENGIDIRFLSNQDIKKVKEKVQDKKHTDSNVTDFLEKLRSKGTK